MAYVQLVTANDRSYPDSAKDRSVGAVRSDKPVVKQWAREGLVHCSTTGLSGLTALTDLSLAESG